MTAVHETPTQITAMHATCISANGTARSQSMRPDCSAPTSAASPVSTQRCRVRSRRQRRRGRGDTEAMADLGGGRGFLYAPERRKGAEGLGGCVVHVCVNGES